MERKVGWQLLLAILVVSSASAYPYRLQHVSPLPGSRLVTCQTGITLRARHPFGVLPDDTHGLVKINGTISGSHSARLMLSDDGTALIARPDEPFAPGEEVSVKVSEDVREINGTRVGPWQFSFFTRPVLEMTLRSPAADIGAGDFAIAHRDANPAILEKRNSLPPPDFPPLTITTVSGLTNTEIYLSNIAFDTTIVNSPYLFIATPTGALRFFREMPGSCYDFKWQPTGVMTYFDSSVGGFVAMDSSFSVVDTFKCGNGYYTDVHDFRLLPGGHAILMSYDPEPVGMDTVVPGGNPSATVLGLIIQELDCHKNVVFQWRSWDHLAITDAEGVDFQAPTVDYVHGNAIEIDADGNLLVSSRHMSQIIKIDRQTGDVIWRWGGKKNEFQILGDSTRFSYQHAVRRLPNGHITIFDNGDMRPQHYSRVVEYDLNEEEKIATLVWEYRHTPDIYSVAMGYAERRDDGTTLIGWGAANPTVTIIDTSKTTLFEMSFPQGVYSYRAYAFPPLPGSPVTSVNSVAPQHFALLQNYPNPFNPTTTITYQLPGETRVQLKVFDILGRDIATLVDGEEGAGSHTVRWDGSRYPSGVYFYELATATSREVRKMLLQK